MTSPTRRAAMEPASVAAFTDPTSPRTRTATQPLRRYSLPIRTTLAVFTIASAASTAPTKPRVSINPNASFTLAPCWSSAVTYQEACTKAIDRMKGYCLLVCGSLAVGPLLTAWASFLFAKLLLKDHEGRFRRERSERLHRTGTCRSG